MSPSDQEPLSVPNAAGRFATTHWTLIVAAQDRASPQAQQALAALCGTYWYPLYAFIRRQGHTADQAQDLTQEFFARLLEKDFLGMVDRDKGKFRSFLLAACKHFLANERDRARAQKRGGERHSISLDLRDGETRYGIEPMDAATPEKLFERRWALTLLEQVLARLRAEFQQAGKKHFFDRLKVFLMGDKSKIPYGQVGGELGMSESAVKVAVHRLRRRYRDLLREEIGQTVSDPSHIEDEIRNLFAALGS